MSEEMTRKNRTLYHEFINRVLKKRECPSVFTKKKRVEYVLNLVSWEASSRFMYNVESTMKNSKRSLELRNKGNSLFISSGESRLDKAAEEYTKSVAYAPNGSEELAIAYANRSAVLFEARLISDCVLDIDRALRNNYPDHLKAKVLLRRTKCLQILDPDNHRDIKTAFAEAMTWVDKMDGKKQEIMMTKLQDQAEIKMLDYSEFFKWDPLKYLPKLKKENPSIPGLSDAVDLTYSEKHGRHMVATRDIEPGETLAVQKACVKVVHIDARYKLCWHCGEQTWASVPCKDCVEVVFCSEKCREDGCREHHDIECPVIKTLIALNVIVGVNLPLRLIVKAYKEVGSSVLNLKSHLRKIDTEKGPHLKGFINRKRNRLNFSNLYRLRIPCVNETVNPGLILGDAILIAFLLATRTEFFGRKRDENLNSLAMRGEFIFTIGLLEKLVIIAGANTFEASFQSAKKREELLGLMVPTLSFFNHSCNPMTIRTTHGDYMVITANRPLKKGDQIFDGYGPHYIMTGRKERRASLLQKYHFYCCCEACENDWPQKVVFHHDKMLDKPETAWEIRKGIFSLNDRFQEMKVIEDSYNRAHHFIFDVTEDVAEISGIIAQCFRYYGRSSGELFCAQRNLAEILSVNGNRVLFLD